MRCSALDVFVGLHLSICVLLLDVGASLRVGVSLGVCTHLRLAVLTCDTVRLPSL